MRIDKMYTSARALALVAVLAVSGSATASPVTGLERGSQPEPVQTGAASEHVVVISIDGLRPDAIERFGATTLQGLIRGGSHSPAARTILPSKTLPSHTSMLTGEEPEIHGITWNTNLGEAHGYPQVPTIFARARAHGLRTAAFASKGKFQHLNVPGSLDYARIPEGNAKWKAGRTAELVEEYLAAERPNLLFVHFAEPDAAGHTFSWMSWFYGRAVRQADRAVARVLAAADRAFGEGSYVVIVTADHGGHGWKHGSADARDVNIPWIIHGPGVEAGEIIAGDVRTTDTAATALWLLGVPAQLAGTPVRGAFAAAALAAEPRPGAEAPAQNGMPSLR